MAIGDYESSDDESTDVSEIDSDQDSTDISDLSDEESDNEIENELKNISWSNERPKNAMYAYPLFNGPARGPINNVSSFLECIQLYLNSDVMNLIVQETNRVLEARGSKRNRQGQKVNRKLLTVNELWLYIAVVLLDEIHNKSNSRDNWSTNDLLLTPIFGKIMTRDRYEEISQNLHFADNTDMPTTRDKFWEIRKLFDLFNESFQRQFNLDKTVRVQRYIPSKADKRGVKFHVLEESRSGYIWRVLIDEGKNTKITFNSHFPHLKKPGQCVMELMLPLLGTGHLIVMDSFYTDLQLFDYLVRNSMSCLGTVKRGQRLLPKEITEFDCKEREKGEMVIKYSTHLYAFCWIDNTEVRMLSSVSIPEKDMDGIPYAVRAYDAEMCATDRKRHGLITGRKRLKKCYKSVFYHLLDMALTNAFIVANCKPEWIVKQREFRLNLIKEILDKYSEVVPDINNTPVQHTLIKLKQGRCLFPTCKSKSSIFCQGCNRYVCAVPCFSATHVSIRNE